MYTKAKVIENRSEVLLCSAEAGVARHTMTRTEVQLLCLFY